MIENNTVFCPAQKAFEMISGKWRLIILHTLLNGTKRFNELEKSIHGINTRMLAKELKSMESLGLINRKVYASVPPKVEYSLTEKGKNLETVLKSLSEWGLKYLAPQ